MNLIQRVLTSLLLLPGLLFVIHKGGWSLGIALIFVSGVLMPEILAMGYFASTRIKFIVGLVSMSLMLTLVYTQQVQVISYSFWILLFCFGSILVFQPSFRINEIAKISFLLIIMEFCILGLTSLFLLRMGPQGDGEMGRSFLYLALLSTFGNDTFAYFIGRKWGKRKLMAKVSEKKTWEGFLAGAIASLGLPFLVEGLSQLLFNTSVFSPLSVQDLICVGLGISFLGPLGDLIESRAKRALEVKDSGSILPGHGGLFDRIDALLVTVPFTYCYAFFLRSL